VKGEQGGVADRELARLVRDSRTLDPATKRSWLRVLPHLTHSDRARLREILQSETLETWMAPPEDAPRP
jgi:hypothetical protein